MNKPIISVCMMEDCQEVISDPDNIGLEWKHDVERWAIMEIIDVSHGLCRQCLNDWVELQDTEIQE